MYKDGRISSRGANQPCTGKLWTVDERFKDDNGTANMVHTGGG
eukprot:CAMPEP_0174315228 /NCGR_PEP_ID=MMETSP0810-20121108/6157_1 /TAXON_ID=73025 ORGANISM="Eutreptiella gymnastica-like, Strain CCMP1594" /NCGR_SAMPLE_ID=MMETSP0810 /ASSEMBLY_ACC=CAM_ASM_000659 /LENGTH=42 /DNA_ID= /DNA_START= /DNA_END= /DNA_ORIENTATION=